MSLAVLNSLTWLKDNPMLNKMINKAKIYLHFDTKQFISLALWHFNVSMKLSIKCLNFFIFHSKPSSGIYLIESAGALIW